MVQLMGMEVVARTPRFTLFLFYDYRTVLHSMLTSVKFAVNNPIILCSQMLTSVFKW